MATRPAVSDDVQAVDIGKGEMPVFLYELPCTNGILRPSIPITLTCLLIVCGGCRDGGPSRAAVSGRVTVDGVAVDNGSISFSPANGNQGPTAGGNIENGRYLIDTQKGPVVGSNVISIVGVRKTGKQVPSSVYPKMLVDEVEAIVPEQYSGRSTLKRDLKPGSNIVDFDLSSK